MRLAILSAILFISGASGLLFQTLWLRRSGLAFGNAVWSAALILSSFMAGLALGNALAATSRLPRWRPLRLYAALEIAIAISGIALVMVFPFVGELLRPLFASFSPYPAALHALRFALSFALLLVPTAAMGLTLPVLLGDPTLRRIHFHRATAALYGCNTLGAVLGALAGEAWLVARFGLTGTAVAAGLMNLGAAAGAWWLARSDDGAFTEVATPPPAAKRIPAPRLPWRWLAVSFASGAIFLALEVVWFRFLRLYVASSPVAFATMLAVVLAGIGTGSLVSTGLSRKSSQMTTWLVPLLLAAGLLVILTYVWFPVPALRGATDATYVETPREIGWLAGALTFPVACVAGMVFPALMAQFEARVGNRRRSAGLVTLANTLGAAAGPLVAGFVLLPRAGYQASLLLCAVGYALAAVVVGDRGAWSWRTARGKVALGLGAVLASAILWFPRARDDVHFTNARRPYTLDGSRLTAKIEGTADTYQLLRRDYLGQPYSYRLVTNGFSMSGTDPRSQRYMRLFAYLPLALHPHAADALLICYGVGVTADAFTQDPQIRRLDVVDIAQEVFALSANYAPPAHRDPLRDPRVTTWRQDGRFFLQASARHYDIITGEPPPLKMAGTVNLYTEEFFRAMSERLNDGGMATFWLPIYQLRVEEVKAILAAFHAAFPNASVWGGADQEWIMMGVKGAGQRLAAKDLERLWQNAATHADLMRIGLETPAQLGALFIMDAPEIERITAGMPPLTDEFPKRLSDAPPEPAPILALAASYLDAAAAYQHFRSSPLIARVWPESLRDVPEVLFAVRDTRFTTESHGGNWLAELDLYLRHTTLRTPVLDVLHSDDWKIAIAEARARGATAPPSEALPDLVAAAVARRDYAGAIRWLDLTRDQPVNPNDPFLLIYLYCVSGRVREAQAYAAAHLALLPRDGFRDWLWQKLRDEFGYRPPA